jgi:hypothetical protein
MTKEKLKPEPGEPTEREQMLARFEEACRKADLKQEENRAKRDQYRKDDKLKAKMRAALIKDLLRVYDHPDNPYSGWAASRKRYRELGWYPEIIVTDLFGTHTEFERAAGLRDKRGTSKVKLAIARLHTEKEIERYAEETIMPHVNKWNKAYRDRTGIKTVATISDAHGPYIDPLVKRAWLDTLKILKPDGIIFDGDIVDFPEVSRHTKMPGDGSLVIQEELDFVREEIFRPSIQASPKSWRTYHIGNHEQRLVRYIADTAPALASLRCLRWDRLLELDELKIELVFGGSWLAPRQKDRTENIKRTFKVYYDCFAVTHGKSCAKNAMEEELKRYQFSGASGHTHRPGLWTMPTLRNPNLSWTSLAMAAGYSVGKNYVEGPGAWTMGFGFHVIDPGAGIVIPMPVFGYEDMIAVGMTGKVYRPTPEEKEIRRQQWRSVL